MLNFSASFKRSGSKVKKAGFGIDSATFKRQLSTQPLKGVTGIKVRMVRAGENRGSRLGPKTSVQGKPWPMACSNFYSALDPSLGLIFPSLQVIVSSLDESKQQA